MDFANMKARKVGVYTDQSVSKLLPMQTARESLDANSIDYVVFDKCRVEPNQESWQEGIQFAKDHDISHFLAVGGGVGFDAGSHCL
jgi:hydroxyacid-oxoacid transhydrogenase